MIETLAHAVMLNLIPMRSKYLWQNNILLWSYIESQIYYHYL